MDELIRRASFSGSTTFLLVTAALLTGCQTPQMVHSRCFVAKQLTSRFGAITGPTLCPAATSLPSGIDLQDGLTEEEAVTTAMWNNAAFQETMSELGISNAQLFDAGLISDPQFVLFFPLGPKQLELTGYQAIDAFWLQPVRKRAAELDLDRVSQNMVQNGLNLIRDVRVSHANFVFAWQQARITREAAGIRQQIADLARHRLQAGDISELEANATAIEALQANATADRADLDVTLLRQRMQTLMGLTLSEYEWIPDVPEVLHVTNRDSTDVVNEALAMRPDLRAAEIAVDMMCTRSELARNQFMTLDAIYDANSAGTKGFESGPGLRFTLPIFNGNRGQIAIADAQQERARRQYVTIRDQITLDVRTAHTQLQQATKNLRAIQQQILPALREAQELAQRNYTDGGTSYFLVLQTTGQYLDTRSRELQLQADVRRFIAELDRSVGRRISGDVDIEKIAVTMTPALVTSLIPEPPPEPPAAD